jgi:hypothetical protein
MESKIFNDRIYVVIGVIVVCIGLAFFVRTYLTTREVKASVSPSDIEAGIPVVFADSTKGADEWLWEFGNGDTSSVQKGMYTYPETGRYQIRLTVNGRFEKKFIVKVRVKKGDDIQNELVKIVAPPSGIQGEYIVFRGVGPSKEWRWEFGETGAIDAREQTVIYKYDVPGRYEVRLSTEDTKYPVRHTIVIDPQYMENDTTDVATLIGNDIKEKLQAIANRKPFNTNYNYILSNYLCKNSNAVVIVNNTKKNDFYSYCQGLRLTGKGKTSIENVLVDIDPETGECIQRLIVIQSDNE